LYYIIEAAVENNKEVIICDRPIISDPDYVDGFLLDTNFKSFVGTIPTPVVYGMSSGELAKFINGEAFSGRANLKIFQMTGYKRSTDYSSLKLKWIKPSPSITTPMAAVIYPSTCFLEGTNVNEGRGTDKPFEYFGAPWMNSKQVMDSLNSFILEGVRFDTILYTPTHVISDHKPKFLYEECNGISITVTDKRTFEPVKTGIAILVALYKIHPEFQFNPNNFIDKLAGTDQLRMQITEGKGYYDIINSYEKDLRNFDFIRSKYLIYN
jgi:beta-N-acetylhexosaminidase